MMRLFFLPAIFVISTFCLLLMIKLAPDFAETSNKYKQVKNNESQQTTASFSFELPSGFENFTKIAEQFKTYKDNHYIYITTLFASIYLYKQTFAIPGSFLLNILAGILYDLWPGFIICCVLTTCGSSLCYLFSELFSREYVLYYFGERISYLQQKVDDAGRQHRLLAFLLFARMFPISPSWLLNIVAPFLNIPLPIFAFSAFVGLAPYNFICVQAGYILGELKSWDDVFSSTNIIKLSSLALIPLAYAIFKRPKDCGFTQTLTERLRHTVRSMQILFGRKPTQRRITIYISECGVREKADQKFFLKNQKLLIPKHLESI